MADTALSPTAAAHAFDQPEAYRQALLEWYDRQHRELPWRGVDDPYLVWVAEVMLQQTQVATVIDYFNRWRQRFPCVEALAEADIEDVLELWAGLGYYRRARFLHESARMVVDQMGGELPDSADELEQLKGVGPYTAGAIASIAFGQAVPVVDGNVERVLSRLRAIDGDPKARANQKLYWELAAALVDPSDPGAFNQAMMELGATVCTPKSPACMLCPVREHCRGFASDDPTRYPAVAKRSRQRPMTVRTAVVCGRRDGQELFALVKRPPQGLLAGLWEFPCVEAGEQMLAEYIHDRLGIGSADTCHRRSIGELVHHFSHIRMTVQVEAWRLDVEPAAEPAGDFDRPVRFVTRDEFQQMAVSAAMHKVLAAYDAAIG